MMSFNFLYRVAKPGLRHVRCLSGKSSGKSVMVPKNTSHLQGAIQAKLQGAVQSNEYCVIPLTDPDLPFSSCEYIPKMQNGEEVKLNYILHQRKSMTNMLKSTI